MQEPGTANTYIYLFCYIMCLILFLFPSLLLLLLLLLLIIVPGVSATPYEDNLRYFNVAIAGPNDSPYEGNYWLYD